MTALLSPKKAAAELDISVKTLRGHVKDGTIHYILTGRGKKRPRIAFEECDLEQFKQDRKRRDSAPCQSTDPKVTRSTTSTSKSEVIGFLARRERAIAERQSKSKS